MKSLETQLAEAQTEISRLKRLLGDKGTILKKISESGLPAIAQERVYKRLASSDTDVDRTIAEEKRYLNQIRAGKGSHTVDLTESDARKLKIAEAYKAAGLSDKEARLAAGLEVTVEDLDDSQRKLFDAAKSIMPDSQARIFAQRRGRF